MKIDDYVSNYLNKKSDVEHALYVEKLAVGLYNGLLDVFSEKLKPLEKQLYLLQIAAKLHDIGNFFGNNNVPHNKAGAKIVIENKIDGLNEVETLIVANLIRYHRGKNPKESHKLYSKLSEENKNVVRIFSSILKIADVLDYEHFSLVENVKCTKNLNILTLQITPNPLKHMGFEQSFNKKKGLFEEIFMVDVEII